MYLSKIHLHGFKSFAQKTDLLFDPGITAIVGPNGCGKSNVVDAVRWVLGEQRARLLRSDKMENVIFNGAARRRALGMAEVAITIENTRNVLPTEYTEVTITRRLYRSGESEYLLNNVVCRLKDILDLFMDTGMGANAYSIIELKMVDDILSESAQDRRRLFEEAAGITKYKMRRTQTLRKLDTTQADLTRIRDLTAEIEKQVRSLERQARKAARYVDLKARLEHLELSLARVEFDRYCRLQSSIQDEIAETNRSITDLDTRLSAEEAALEAERKRLVDAEQGLSERQKELNEHIDKMRRHELDLRLERERENASKNALVTAHQEQRAASERRARLESEIGRMAIEKDTAAPLLEERAEKASKAREERDIAQRTVDEQRAALRKAREREQEAAADLAARKNELNRLLNRLELIEAEIERGTEHSDRLKAALEALQIEVTASASIVGEKEKALAKAQRELDETVAELELKHRLLHESTDKLQSMQRRHDALVAEERLLESLISSYEEFSDSVRFLAGIKSWTREPPQTVADLVSCGAADRMAIDAALGEYASCFVVRSEAEARDAISLLHSEQKGQAAFFVLERLPLNGIWTNGQSPPQNEATKAIDLVRIESESHRPLLSLLLRDCYIVDTFEQAEELAGKTDPEKFSARFVSRSGEWVYPHGLIYGGSRNAEAPSTAHRIGRREQLDTARGELAAVARSIEEQTKIVDSLKTEIESLAFEKRRSALADAERVLAEAKQAHNRKGYEFEAQLKADSDITGRLKELRNDLEAGRSRMAELRDAAQAAEKAETGARQEAAGAESDLQEAEIESRRKLSDFSDANLAVVEARNSFDNIQRELSRTQNERDRLSEGVQVRAGEIERLEQTISQANNAADNQQRLIDEASTRKELLDTGVIAAETEVLQRKSVISETEAGVKETRRNREQLMVQEGRLQARYAEAHTRVEALEERLRDEYEIEPADLPDVDDASFSESEAREAIPSLRSQIRNLGGVNELALEDFETEKERLAFMREQQQDLESAEHTLLSTIKEINTTAADRFDRTFGAIRDHFSRIFAQLFTEGDAEVFLTGEKDPLESPVEIVARPHGKKPSTIAQLSGGEKTLTAIALLFAIYLVKPSPFCILDEVDAPLDDANIERFMRLIRDFASSTQFILVTHNKRTMEAADRMYGITMQEQGVSRLVGVAFDERLEMAD